MSLTLLCASAIAYTIHYFIFKDFHHISIYTLHDIAFVPIEVLFVTLILHQLLAYRENKNKLRKLNMVIGAFFSEIGTDLIAFIAEFDPFQEEIRKQQVKVNVDLLVAAVPHRQGVGLEPHVLGPNDHL